MGGEGGMGLEGEWRRGGEQMEGSGNGGKNERMVEETAYGGGERTEEERADGGGKMEVGGERMEEVVLRGRVCLGVLWGLVGCCGAVGCGCCGVQWGAGGGPLELLAPLSRWPP